MKKCIYTIWLLSLILTACSGEGSIDGGNVDNKRIELSFQISNFVKGPLKSSTDVGLPEEQTIENLYVFLFPTVSSRALKKYDISTPAFAGGSWSNADKKVSLDLTQAEAGKRNVYIIANYSSSLKTLLDTVRTITGLQSLLLSNDTPWSLTLKTPILMSGNTTHNFISNNQLSSVSLIRALSKVQLNIKLSSSHQAAPMSAERTAQYRYKLINFDRNTYVVKPVSKAGDLVSSSAWVSWSDLITLYTLDSSGKVTSLTLTTYLNESDNAGTAIEISVPYIDAGSLPPPEFGDETYKLKLPAKIERNNWYVYDIEI